VVTSSEHRNNSYLQKVASYFGGIDYVDPVEGTHTSDIKKLLYSKQIESTCVVDREGAVLLRNGRVVQAYPNVEDPNTCSNCGLKDSGACKFQNINQELLDAATEGDHLLCTRQPDNQVAEQIRDKGIEKVVFIAKRIDHTGTIDLIRHGVLVRQAGFRFGEE
jgi:deoxycytidylate deaminase